MFGPTNFSPNPRELSSIRIFSSVGCLRGGGLSCKYESGTRTSRVLSSDELLAVIDLRGRDCTLSDLSNFGSACSLQLGEIVSGDRSLGVYGTYSRRESVVFSLEISGSGWKI